MAETYDTSQPDQLLKGMRLARQAIGRGELVVVPTDTVYGLAADAFQPAAVRALVEAKGRTLASPPPVLIPGAAQLEALAESIPAEVRILTNALWPGAFTVIVPANPSLDWDLGETHGTVALRVPDDEIVRALLEDTGPLAVSSANLTGQPPARTAAEADGMLGASVAVILDGGERGERPSTIVDATGVYDGGKVRIVREGVIPRSRIEQLIGSDRCE